MISAQRKPDVENCLILGITDAVSQWSAPLLTAKECLHLSQIQLSIWNLVMAKMSHVILSHLKHIGQNQNKACG